MLKKLIIATVFVLFIFPKNAYSQQPGYWSLQYATGFATGDLGDFISQASFRGILVEYRKGVNDNIFVGADFGWQVFYEKVSGETYSSGTASLTGDQFRTQNLLPMLVTADYFFSTDNPLKPYVGLGLGTMYVERATDMNLYRIEENPWCFAVKPEFGFLYEVSFDTYFKLAAKYYNGFKTEQLDSQGYFSISAGMVFNL